MKIYTKTGDDGTTGLIGGSRVVKSAPRIECFGEVDELNAALGLAGAIADAVLRDRLCIIQNDLFVIGSHLACPDAVAMNSLPKLRQNAVIELESQIDQAESQLQPLTNFILPGGSDLSARLHLARTICRRTERVVVHFAMDNDIEPNIVVYLNRLSDWLFVQARLANQLTGVNDIPWKY